MTETLSKAWSLFDAGNYTDAETLYKRMLCKRFLPPTMTITGGFSWD